MSRRSGALALGDLKIPGYKLENGRRLVVQRETLVAFGKSPSKGGAGHVAELERFFSTNTLKPYADNVLPHVAEPIEFTTPDVEIDLVGFAVFGKSAAGRAMREAQLLPERTKDTIRLRKAEAQERRDARRGQKYIFTLRRAAGGAA